MIIIGIDPGVSGAMAMIDGDRVIAVRDLPTVVYGKLKWIDACELLAMLRKLTGARIRPAMRAYVEHTHAMPKMGVIAANSKGLTLGSVLATLQVWGVSVQLVSPQSWKREFGLISPKSKDREKKLAALSRARLLFPTADLDRHKDHNRADALLIAAFGARAEAGQSSQLFEAAA